MTAHDLNTLIGMCCNFGLCNARVEATWRSMEYRDFHIYIPCYNGIYSISATYEDFNLDDDQISRLLNKIVPEIERMVDVAKESRRVRIEKALGRL